MSKKDFLAIARALRCLPPTVHASAEFRETLNELCKAFEALNPRFDRARFARAVLDGLVVERPGTRERPL